MRPKLPLTGIGVGLALFGAAYAVACGGQDNAADRWAVFEQRNPDAAALRDASPEAAPPPYEQRTTVFPDQGSAPVICGKSEVVENAIFQDFEIDAIGWFKFDDGSAPPGRGLLPIEASVADLPYFGLAAVTLPEPRCGSTRALHIQGGPFSIWGGGFGTSTFMLTGTLAEENGLDPTVVTAYYPTRPMPNPDDPTSAQIPIGVGVNASAYEGISFWARRADNSQPSFRLVVGDRYTFNEAARIQFNTSAFPEQFAALPQEGPFCGRFRACIPEGAACADGKPCSPFVDENDVTTFFCYEPGVDPDPGTDATVTYERCDTSSCLSGENLSCRLEQESPQQIRCTDVTVPGSVPGDDITGFDAQFDGKPCTPHIFSDSTELHVCYDPSTDPVPPDENERCDNGWTKVVTVGADWEFFRIPWEEFGQTDGLQAPGFGIGSIWGLNIQFTQGPVDFYIDDLAFYR